MVTRRLDQAAVEQRLTVMHAGSPMLNGFFHAGVFFLRAAVFFRGVLSRRGHGGPGGVICEKEKRWSGEAAEALGDSL